MKKDSTVREWRRRVACGTFEGGGAAASWSSCDASPYHWTQKMLYVCAEPLPFHEITQFNVPVQVARIVFINYNLQWVDKIATLCITNTGPSPLDELTEIQFIPIPYQMQAPVVVNPPWPNNGRVCAPISIRVGAESTGIVEVWFTTAPSTLPVGAKYQVEIVTPSDVELGGNADIPVDGNFPVTSGEVRIIKG